MFEGLLSPIGAFMREKLKVGKNMAASMKLILTFLC